MEDREEEAKLLNEAGLPAGEDRVLRMMDAGQAVGYAVVGLEGATLHIRKLAVNGYTFTEKPTGDPLFYLDTLTRAAASWGEDHGAVAIVTDFPDFFDFFKSRDFAVEEGRAHTPMSTIVRYERGGR